MTVDIAEIVAPKEEKEDTGDELQRDGDNDEGGDEAEESKLFAHADKALELGGIGHKQGDSKKSLTYSLLCCIYVVVYSTWSRILGKI